VSQRTQRVIGLLGGIGSGKSAVARILEENGASVIDADRITAECLRDPDVLSKIEKEFGSTILDDFGAVDRKALADAAFADEASRQQLHAIIHPAIAARMAAELEHLRAAGTGRLIVIDAPLLFESRFRSECDVLLMIRSPRETRIERVSTERGWNASELDRRESFQASIEEKEEAADAVIDNTSGLEDLRRRVLEFLEALASGRFLRPQEKE
jgi:dephospho-CoA kinase